MLQASFDLYEVRPRKDKRGVDLISDVLPFGRLWYRDPNAVSYAICYAVRSTSSDAIALGSGNHCQPEVIPVASGVAGLEVVVVDRDNAAIGQVAEAAADGIS